jgi:hypothetical protein
LEYSSSRALGLEHKSEKRKKVYTKNELIDQLTEVRKKEWITLTAHRQDRDGGIGNTLEDLLGVPENNIPLADYGEFELKTHRTSSNSMISLFSCEPEPGSVIPSLLKDYGWPIGGYGPNERSLRVDIDADACAERGFIARIDYGLKRVELHFDSTKVPNNDAYQRWLNGVEKRVGLGDLNPIPYWTFENLEKKVQQKIRNMVYVSVDTMSRGGRQMVRMAKAQILLGGSLNALLKGVKEGWLQIEFNARTHHNHGTRFRTWERFWPKLYSSTEALFV